MLSKTLALTLALTLSGSAPSQERDLEKLLPSPGWVLEYTDELGFDAAIVQDLRVTLRAARESQQVAREQVQVLEAEMRAALKAEPLDANLVRDRFERILQLENDAKRLQLEARLSVMTRISPQQRQKARAVVSRALTVRMELRGRIERIRALGQRLAQSNRGTSDFRSRLPRIEKLIRGRRIHEALREASQLHRDMLEELE